MHRLTLGWIGLAAAWAVLLGVDDLLPDRAGDVLTGLPAEHRTAMIVQVARSFGRDVARRDGRLPALSGYREALHIA